MLVVSSPNPVDLPPEHKAQVMERYVQAAVDCYGRELRPYAPIEDSKLANAIVDAAQKCANEQWLLIDAYNRLYGKGGEGYLVGPFLEGLPKWIQTWLADHPIQQA